jgi:hypothetical protein
MLAGIVTTSVVIVVKLLLVVKKGAVVFLALSRLAPLSAELTMRTSWAGASVPVEARTSSAPMATPFLHKFPILPVFSGFPGEVAGERLALQCHFSAFTVILRLLLLLVMNGDRWDGFSKAPRAWPAFPEPGNCDLL